MPAVDIAPLGPDQIAAYDAHFARHRAESGLDGFHFMPFAPGEQPGPEGLDPHALLLSLDEPRWQRWWVAWAGNPAQVVGHVNLKGGRLPVEMHRCSLGIGIEAPFRGAGLGERLMRAAIEFCQAEPSLVWLDLFVFAHNRPARALYQRLGFAEVGSIDDRFRIAGDSVGDVAMTLRVGGVG